MDSYISVNKVSKWYGNTHVLNNISFDVRENQFVALVGPSGCGKTTLLKIIGGVLAQSSGEVLIKNQIVSWKTIKGRIGFVFQKSVLLRWRTVYENLKLPFEILDRDGYDRRINSLLKLVKLPPEEYAEKYPSELSGGEEQRVALARALTFDPLVLLMDEPFGALDAQLRKTMNFELLRIWHEQKKTVLFVTHDIDEAIFMADKVIILSSKPAVIKKEISVNLMRPRKWEFRNYPQYLDLVKEAEDALYSKEV